MLNPQARKKNYFMLYLQIGEQRKIKYSQARTSFCRLYSYDKETHDVEEVKTEGYIDEYKIIHSIAPYDESKGYFQAKNLSEAKEKIQLFIDNKNEKEEAKADHTELP